MNLLHSDKQVLNNEPDIVVGYKKSVLMTDIALPTRTNRKKEYDKLEKYQEMK